MFDKVVKIGILFDFYGKLLSDKQYTVIELYYIHDLSLSEIAEQMDISRQGVFDILKRAESNLYEYESKLGLVSKFKNNMEKIKEIFDYTCVIEEEADKFKLNKIKDYTVKIRDIVLDILDISQEVK